MERSPGNDNSIPLRDSPEEILRHWGPVESDNGKAKKRKIILDKKVLNCYYQINTDSIPGGETPPTATL
jgi:hypothetical protein